MPRGPIALGDLSAILHLRLCFGVDNAEVGIQTWLQAPFALQIPDLCRIGCPPSRNLFKGASTIRSGIDHQRQQPLNGGKTRWTARVRLIFFFKGVRGVIGRQHFDGAIVQSRPHRLSIFWTFQGRVHLHP